MALHAYYCGNINCPTRYEVQPDDTIGRLFPRDPKQIPDGEVWLCRDCREVPPQ